MWKSNIAILSDILDKLTIHDSQGNRIDQDQGFLSWKNDSLNIRGSNKRVFFIGNGASASMASHFAADLAKNGRINTEVFTDLSLITAIANDISYERVFSEPLKMKMNKGDMLVAISSSGNSPNVLFGVDAAIDRSGIVVTLSAMKENNFLRKKGNLNFYVPAETYGLAETAHAAILHFWMDSLVEMNEIDPYHVSLGSELKPALINN